MASADPATPDNDGAARRRRLRIGQPRSLQSRQLWAASVGLVAFLALAGYALDRSFQTTAQSGMREPLHAYARANAPAVTAATVGGIVITPPPRHTSPS